MKTRIKVLVFIALVLGAGVAFAAEGHGAEHVGPSLSGKWAHFLAYLVIMYWLLKKPAANFWTSRRLGILESVSKGEIDIQAATKRIDEARLKLSSVEAEISRMKTELTRETEHETAQIIAEAKSRAAQILARAQTTAAAEERAAENAVRREVAEKIIASARERLEKEITDDSDKRLRGAALKGIPALVQEN